MGQHNIMKPPHDIMITKHKFVICKAVTCVVMFYYCNVKSQVHDVMLTFHNVKSCHHDVMLTFYNVVSQCHVTLQTVSLDNERTTYHCVIVT
jgi:hypothetical protein